MEKKVNWIPALVLYCVSSVLSLIINPTDLEGYLWYLLVLPVSILATAFMMILLFKCWKALPEAHRKTTPGKAVGFLFIPFYNFYWVFVSFPALAKGYHHYGDNWGRPVDYWFTNNFIYDIQIICHAKPA